MVKEIYTWLSAIRSFVVQWVADLAFENVKKDWQRLRVKPRFIY